MAMLDTFSNGDLTIEVQTNAEPAPGSLTLRWMGTSNHRQPATILAPFFASVLAEATESGASVEMRFEALEHFNSSTITAIIQVVQEARARGVRLTITFDPSLKWQRLSFDALRIFVKSDGLLELSPLPPRAASESRSLRAAAIYEP